MLSRRFHRDNAYQKTFLVYSIGLRANLIAEYVITEKMNTIISPTNFLTLEALGEDLTSLKLTVTTTGQ